MTEELTMSEDQETPTFVLKDALQRNREFTGVHIAAASTETPDYPRWTTMDLYRTDDGRYILYTVGHSVVYHLINSPCNSGTYTEADRLPEDAEPCPRCAAPAHPDGPVNLENPLIKLVACADADGVRTALTHTDRKTGTVAVSHVAQRLLMDAARKDPAFDPDSSAEPL